jgi:hypothetical protein
MQEKILSLKIISTHCLFSSHQLLWAILTNKHIVLSQYNTIVCSISSHSCALLLLFFFSFSTYCFYSSVSNINSIRRWRGLEVDYSGSASQSSAIKAQKDADARMEAAKKASWDNEGSPLERVATERRFDLEPGSLSKKLRKEQENASAKRWIN